MAAPTFAPRPSNPSTEGSRSAVTPAAPNRGVAVLAMQPAAAAPAVAACRAKREFRDCHDRRCPVRASFGAFSTIFFPRGKPAAWSVVVASATNLVGLTMVQDDFAVFGTAVEMAGGAATAVGLAASARWRHIAGALVVRGSRLAAQMPDLA